MEQKRIIDRLDEFLRYRGLRDAQVARECGIANGTFYQARNGKFDISKRVIDKVLATYPDINRVWLITGEGEMLNYVKPTQAEGTILIPVVNLDTVGATKKYNEEVGVVEYQTGWYPFPREIAHEGDVVIPVYNDSMAPAYVSGSMVLIRPVPMWREYLEMGVTYIVELEDDRRLIKTVMKGEDADHYLLVSINPAYQPSEVKKSFIRSVWRVIMSVRRESL